MKSIGEEAFDVCYSLTDVCFGSGLLDIGSGAFYNCPISTLTFNDSLLYIGDSAFENCDSLESVTLGRDLEDIGDNAFLYCSGLSTVVNRSSLDIEEGLPEYGYIALYATEVISE